MKCFGRILFLILGSSFLVGSPSGAQTRQAACLVCNFKFSPESAQKGEANPCDDLFAAACLNANGQAKHAGISERQAIESEALILRARDEGSKKRGYANFAEEMKSSVQKELGLEFKDSLPHSKLASLANPDAWVSADDFFKESEQCESESASLGNADYYSMDVESLKRELRKRESFVEKYREINLKFQAQDIPSFVSGDLGRSCSDYNASNSPTKERENPELKEICPRFERVRREAIDLYRSEGESDYQKKAEAFVRKYSVPVFRDSGYIADSEAGQNGESQGLISKIENLQIDAVCSDFSSVVTGALEDVRTKVFDNNSISKSVVEGLIGSTYTPARKQQMDAIFATARSDIQDVVKSVVRDPAKRSLIVDEYDSFEYFWLEKPAANLYRQAPGEPVLDREKIARDSDLSYFADSSLSFFSSFNAFYLPQTRNGKTEKAEHINMKPGMLPMLDTNPYVFLSVVAHEMGHKIGPEVSRINGHDMSSEYREVLACYKDSKSIKMSEEQKDEVIADFISSEVLARQIARLPADKRQQAVMSSMQDFCVFHDQRGHSLSCEGTHPDPSLRVGGVYGANPNIRKVMGCEKDSPRFKTCGLSSIASVQTTEGARESTGGPARATRSRGAQ